MRHRKRHSKLSMMADRRKATLRNMVRSLFTHQKIETILARAKATRRIAEKLITIAQKDTVHARRMAYVVLEDRVLVAKLFNEIAPLFKTRKGGYTRIIQVGFRRGDGASMCILELTEKKVVEKVSKKKAKIKDAEVNIKGGEEKAKKEKAEVPAKEGVKKAPKGKAATADGKDFAKEKTEEKPLDKKPFMKNLRGFFHRKSDH